ncbi:MAG: amino acid ABC transporter permease [Oscillospiraceae bacterium]|nr:amino acid ABC transporter permease [Bacillota bacterium]MBR0040216.1 amino acid ABC transporter permease [Oscillospiraceae bacterium]
MLQTIAAIWDKYGYVYIQGVWGTIYIAVLTVLLGTVLGTLLAFVRLLPSRILQSVIRLYVWILRGTPALLQIYFFYFFVPKYLPFDMSERACIMMALVVNASAYVEEIIRAGIQAVDRGQTEAARSLGMTARHTMTRIILPQAIKNILPALGNEFIVMIKEASLASIFFIVEITSAFKTVQSATFITIPALAISGGLYLLLTTVLSFFMKMAERRLQIND